MAFEAPYRSADQTRSVEARAELRLVARTLDLEFARREKYTDLVIVLAIVGATISVATFSSSGVPLLAFLAAVVAFFFWRHARKRSLSTLTLEVSGASLRCANGQRVFACKVADVSGLSLSEETHEYFQIEGHGVRSAAPDAGGGTGRCALLLRVGAEQHALLQHPISHTEAMEWLPQLRRFLRANGWEPDEDAH